MADEKTKPNEKAPEKYEEGRQGKSTTAGSDTDSDKEERTEGKKDKIDADETRKEDKEAAEEDK